MVGALAALLFLLPGAFACTNIAYGPQCNNSKIIPDCSWIDANSGLICSTLSYNSGVINGDGCSLALNGCVYSNEEVLGAYNFCCLPGAAAAAAEAAARRRAQ